MGHPDEVDVIVCGGGPAGKLFCRYTRPVAAYDLNRLQDVSSPVAWLMPTRA